MKINFKSNYEVNIIIPREVEMSIDIPIEDIINYITDVSCNFKSYNEDDIMVDIDDYIMDTIWDSDNLYLKEDTDNPNCHIDSDYSEQELLNREEIYELILPLTMHLLKEEVISDCCKAVPKDANFCPTCGKRLKK